MKVLVTGGCGYIGSHSIVDLLENGHKVVCVDNCVRSSPDIIEKIQKLTKNTSNELVYYNVDIKDITLRAVFEEHADIAAVIHFAAYKAVGESVTEPLMYYQNNIIGLLNLLECVQHYKVPAFVFSSSCTVYGQPDSMPVSENTPQKPANSPYGVTKQMGERILEDFVKANPQTKVSLLRYFNPAGAHPSTTIGENPNHGVQSLTSAIVSAVGEKRTLKVFGGDYDTVDGSCIRDFIHVCDIASAHRLAIDYIFNAQKQSASIFNLGSGKPNSVLEALAAFTVANKIRVPYEIVDRRPGDVSAIYSNNERANTILGWIPKYTIQDIMKTAWDYYLKTTMTTATC